LASFSFAAIGYANRRVARHDWGIGMESLSVFSTLTWYSAAPEDSGGSSDRLYAAQGESVQVPANTPPTFPQVKKPKTKKVRESGFTLSG
jgi:hypothetical protein